jgi:5-(carboxyamino)imidazole ribonucleotide mutase
MRANTKIAIILGSKSDYQILEEGFKLLEEFRIPYRLEVISAHHNPERLRRFCNKAEKEGIKVIISCAGLSAALPGFIASYVKIPVIGVPLNSGNFGGLESLLSIVEVPRGIGLVSTGIGKKGFINAIIFSTKILSLTFREYKEKLKDLERRFKK